MRKQQSGFTLVEIAIVLVIIGLLLGGVLKGQELVNSARVKSMANDFRNVPVLIYGYQDRFRRLPGDDNAIANERFAGFTPATTGGALGNGFIEGLWNSSTLTDESALFWQHVRGAGLAAGSINISATNLPTNAEGGRFGVQSTPIPPIAGLIGSFYACSESISARAAQQLDATLDDGTPNGGIMRATTTATTASNDAAAAAAATNWNASTYTVCMAY